MEDDLLTLRVSKRTLAKYGEVITASSFDKAQDLINGQSFDIAFFDMNLHGSLHGLDLVALATSKDLYPVVVSAESQRDIIKLAFERGA